MKKLIIASVVAGACALGLASVTKAETAAPAAKAVAVEVSVKGVVVVHKDDAGKVTSVSVKSADHKNHKIKLDAEGQKLETMKGEEVSITGTEEDKILTIKTCAVVEKEKKASDKKK